MYFRCDVPCLFLPIIAITYIHIREHYKLTMNALISINRKIASVTTEYVGIEKYIFKVLSSASMVFEGQYTVHDLTL